MLAMSTKAFEGAFWLRHLPQKMFFVLEKLLNALEIFSFPLTAFQCAHGASSSVANIKKRRKWQLVEHSSLYNIHNDSL